MTDLTGRHLIDGTWTEGGNTFESDPVTGDPMTVFNGGKTEIDAAMQAAETAFETYGWTSRDERAAFLDAIAEEIEARVDAITETGMAETGLPEPRLRSVELPRTANQIRLFASHIRAGDYLDRRHDAALPDRQPMPRPDLRMIQRPLGPVGVFGASNFPLAFSTAGGDTAAALAAGCPVVYKGHPGHPGCGELVAQAIHAAIEKTGMPKGVFGFVQSNTTEAGEALVLHPLTRAVGFTGSFGGGKALFDLAMGRDEPIPFYGELGAINPVFVMPAAQSARGGDIGTAWAGSLTMGVGQFCTNPGVVILQEGEGADAFVSAAAEALSGVEAQPMLTGGVAKGYQSSTSKVAGIDGLKAHVRTACEGRKGAPAMFEVSGDDWLAHPELAEEMFGPRRYRRAGQGRSPGGTDRARAARPADGNVADGQRRYRCRPSAGAGIGTQGGPRAGQRLPDRRGSGGCDGARRAVPGLDQLWRDQRRHAGDPPVPASGLLPEHAAGPAACRSARLRRSGCDSGASPVPAAPFFRGHPSPPQSGQSESPPLTGPVARGDFFPGGRCAQGNVRPPLPMIAGKMSLDTLFMTGYLLSGVARRVEADKIVDQRGDMRVDLGADAFRIARFEPEHDVLVLMVDPVPGTPLNGREVALPPHPREKSGVRFGQCRIVRGPRDGGVKGHVHFEQIDQRITLGGFAQAAVLFEDAADLGDLGVRGIAAGEFAGQGFKRL